MNARLSPAEIRTGVRLCAIYTEAAAQILAEEEAAEAITPQTVGEVVAARFRDLIDAPVRFTAYLDGLELSHGRDPAMAAYIDKSRARLAGGSDDREHPESAPDHFAHAAPAALAASVPDTSSPDHLPQVAEAPGGDPSCR